MASGGRQAVHKVGRYRGLGRGCSLTPAKQGPVQAGRAHYRLHSGAVGLGRPHKRLAMPPRTAGSVAQCPAQGPWSWMAWAQSLALCICAAWP